MSTLKITDIINHLNKYIVGQDDAKKELAKAFFIHEYQRRLALQGIEIDRKERIFPHILLTGPTGCGKTEMVTLLCEYLNLHTFSVDMTTLTPAGYIGNSFGSVIRDGFASLPISKYDTTIDDHIVIFCDEFDKIVGDTDSDKNVRQFKKEVQYEFLKAIEGGSVQVSDKHDYRADSIDVSNCLFVLAGNFPDTRKPDITKNVGFGNELETDNKKGKSIIEILTSIGFSTQLAGRVPFIGNLSRLTEEQLHTIVKNPDMISRRARSLLLAAGLKPEFPDKVLEDAVSKAFKTNTGARGLGSTLISAAIDSIMEKDLVLLDTDIKYDQYSNQVDKVDKLRERFKKLNYNIRTYKQELNTFELRFDQLKADKSSPKDLIFNLGASIDDLRERIEEEVTASKLLDKVLKKEEKLLDKFREDMFNYSHRMFVPENEIEEK